MNSLPIVWQEIGSYLRYANARELALLTINASILALVTASFTSDTTSIFLVALKPSNFQFTVMATLIGIAQLILFISFLPTLRGAAPINSKWVALARTIGLVGPVLAAENRNPFFFAEISQFGTATLYFEHLKNHHQNIVSATDAEFPATFAFAQQIWFLSVLTTKKFAQFNIAMSLVWLAGIFYVLITSLRVLGLLCHQL